MFSASKRPRVVGCDLATIGSAAELGTAQWRRAAATGAVTSDWDADDCCSRATRVRYWCRTREAVVPLVFEPPFVLSGSLIITLCSLFCYLAEWGFNHAQKPNVFNKGFFTLQQFVHIWSGKKQFVHGQNICPSTLSGQIFCPWTKYLSRPCTPKTMKTSGRSRRISVSGRGENDCEEDGIEVLVQ